MKPMKQGTQSTAVIHMCCVEPRLRKKAKDLKARRWIITMRFLSRLFIMTENVALPQISSCKVLIKKPFIHYLWVGGGRPAGPAAISSQDLSAEINNHTMCTQFGDELHQPASLLIHPDSRFKINESSPKRLSQHFSVSHFSTGTIPR